MEEDDDDDPDQAEESDDDEEDGNNGTGYGEAGSCIFGFEQNFSIHSSTAKSQNSGFLIF